MKQEINRENLLVLRTRKKYSQAELAEQAKLNKQTVYRLETGRQTNIRKTKLQGLCRALGVEEGVLTGEQPLPPQEAPSSASVLFMDEYQLNVRLDGSTRNAFTLASIRYGVSIQRMVELTPLIVGLVFEQSLRRRQSRLGEFLALLDREHELAKAFPHLPGEIVARSHVGDEAIRQEQQSIDRRDVFGSEVSVDHVDADYDDGSDNPLVTYLREMAAGLPCVGDIERVDGKLNARYRVCRDEALAVAEGDAQLADDILDGWIPLHEMPRELLKKRASAERIAWLRQKSAEARARIDAFFAEAGITDTMLGLSADGDGAMP